MVERRVRGEGRSVRALHPFDPDDRALLQVVRRGEFKLTGFRGRDLQSLLFSTPPITSPSNAGVRAAISRKLCLIRAHRLIRKRPRSYHSGVTATTG